MFKELNMMKLFFEEPNREFNVREFARISKVAPATASKKLRELVKIGLLKERKERFLNLYRADLENDIYRDVKVFYNIRKIKDSGLFQQLNKFYLKPTMILFGSAASGMDTETSDFDLLIISEKTNIMPIEKSMEKRLNRKLQLFVVNSIKNLKNKHLINSAMNGIVLQGEIIWI